MEVRWITLRSLICLVKVLVAIVVMVLVEGVTVWVRIALAAGSVTVIYWVAQRRFLVYEVEKTSIQLHSLVQRHRSR